jgi:hypothetical protein
MLRELGLQRYEAKFREHSLDDQDLLLGMDKMELNEVLMGEVGMKRGHCAKLKQHMRKVYGDEAFQNWYVHT